jgi:tRNA nucleotidyltransferase (CCA-adding enzyme)
VRAVDLRRRFLAELGAHAGLVRALVRAVEARGGRAYLVGGPVRDLLLDRPAGDVDVLLADAEPEALAQALAQELGGRARAHARFHTATLEVGRFRVDLARPRRERYAQPGALPEVEPASFEDDFARRDFTIHAMALPLHPAAGDEIVDLHGGIADLERRVLRTLHAQSFDDDPTRLLRAGRYAARLALGLEAGTRGQFDAALGRGALDTLTGARVLHELERLVVEPDPARAAEWLDLHGVWRALDWAWDAERILPALRALAETRRAPPWPEAADAGVQCDTGLRLLLLAVGAGRDRLLERLGITGRPIDELAADLDGLAGVEAFLATSPRDGALDAQLAGCSERALVLAWCVLPQAQRAALQRYAGVLRHEPSPFDGHAARALGLVGPAIGEFLRSARARALEELPVDEEWQRDWLAQHKRMG